MQYTGSLKQLFPCYTLVFVFVFVFCSQHTLALPLISHLANFLPQVIIGQLREGGELHCILYLHLYFVFVFVFCFFSSSFSSSVRCSEDVNYMPLVHLGAAVIEMHQEPSPVHHLHQPPYTSLFRFWFNAPYIWCSRWCTRYTHQLNIEDIVIERVNVLKPNY